jgi:DNA-binding NarL/FixJ family response regulator
MRPLRIVIADGHRPIAEGVKGLLEPEFDVVSMVHDGKDLLTIGRQEQPDIIVVDICLLGPIGLDVLSRLKREANSAHVIVLGADTDSVYAARSLQAGAVGYVARHLVAGEIAPAIHAALAGRVFVTPRLDGELPIDLPRNVPDGTF